MKKINKLLGFTALAALPLAGGIAIPLAINNTTSNDDVVSINAVEKTTAQVQLGTYAGAEYEFDKDGNLIVSEGTQRSVDIYFNIIQEKDTTANTVTNYGYISLDGDQASYAKMVEDLNADNFLVQNVTIPNTYVDFTGIYGVTGVGQVLEIDETGNVSDVTGMTVREEMYNSVILGIDNSGTTELFGQIFLDDVKYQITSQNIVRPEKNEDINPGTYYLDATSADPVKINIESTLFPPAPEDNSTALALITTFTVIGVTGITIAVTWYVRKSRATRKELVETKSQLETLTKEFNALTKELETIKEVKEVKETKK